MRRPGVRFHGTPGAQSPTRLHAWPPALFLICASDWHRHDASSSVCKGQQHFAASGAAAACRTGQLAQF